MAKTPDLWAEHFRVALVTKITLPPGEGWLTRVEFSKLAKVGTSKTLVYLAAEVKAGRMERFLGSHVVNGSGYPQVWYRPIKKSFSGNRGTSSGKAK